MQLIDGSDADYGRGGIVYNTPDTERPWSWHEAGAPRTFAAMVTPAGLADISRYADGIGPWKLYIIPAQGRDAAGAPVTTLHAARNGRPTTLIDDAHRAGLFVHPYTFRDEPVHLTASYDDDPVNEYRAYFELGVDGVFTDFSTTAHRALEGWTSRTLNVHAH